MSPFSSRGMEKIPDPLFSALVALVALAGVAFGADPMPPPAYVLPPPAASVASPAIGVLLPLSGRYQTFGDSCLKGIRVAVGALDGRTPVVRTIILDTKSDPAQAAAYYPRRG